MITGNITLASLLLTFSLLSMISIFNNTDGLTQNNLEENIKNKQYISYVQSFPFNYSKSSIQDKTNIVQLLSNYIEERIHNAQPTVLNSS